MVGGQRLISWLHPYSTSNVALNTRTCAHVPLMGHPNWAGCDTRRGGHQAGRPPPLPRVGVSGGGRPMSSSSGKPRESLPGGCRRYPHGELAGVSRRGGRRSLVEVNKRGGALLRFLLQEGDELGDGCHDCCACTWKTRPGWVCWEIDREEETDQLIGNSTLRAMLLIGLH
jgi:hypothetical protein